MIAPAPVKILLFVALLACIEADKCREKLEKSIEPKYVSNISSTKLKIRFPRRNVKCGDNVPVTDSLDSPTLKFGEEIPCTNVTIISSATDIEVGAPFLTWTVHNIPAEDFKKGVDGSEGDTKADYFPPTDILPKGLTGKHTLLFLLYCQEHYVVVKRKYNMIEKLSFDHVAYAKRKDLGNPIAGSFFYDVAADFLAVTVPLDDITTPKLDDVTAPELPVGV